MALTSVAEFNRTVLDFQKKYQEAYGGTIKPGKKKTNTSAKKEMENVRISERFLNLNPSSAQSKKNQKSKKGKATQPSQVKPFEDSLLEHN